MNADVDRICDLYKKVSNVPTIARGRVEHLKNSISRVSVDWTQKDLIRSKKVTFNKNYYIKLEDNGKVEKSNESIPEETSRIKLKAVSDDGKKTTLLVTEKKESEENQYIEVWSDQCCQSVIAVKKFKKQHGKILNDVTFSSFLLSPSGSKLLYVAEKVEPKTISYFDDTQDDDDGAPSAKRGAEYVFSEDWGEQEVGIRNPVVVVLDLSTEICSVMNTGEYADISMGQAVWCRDELGVVFVGWDNLPHRLGIVYCTNRRSALYHANLENGTCTRLTNGKGSIYMPRFNPQGTKLVYLESICGGPHHNCAQLNMIRWNEANRSSETVVEVVRQPTNVNQFPGIYTWELPQRCWNENGNIVYFSSQWHSKLEMLCVDTNSKSVDRLKVEGDKHSKMILDVWGCVILACSSSPTHPPSVAVGVLAQNSQAIANWTTIASASCDLTSNLTWDILSLKPTDGDQVDYEAILVTSVENTSPLPPLLVFPHGGPHSAFSCEFHQDVVFMASLGFAVLMVNYRGSPGFGKDGVDSLLGKVGTQDISDVHSAALHVIKLGRVDGDKVVVSGGSHGGFISIHLVGQYPDFYKAASVRNPVVDMARMFTTSDIPDWCCTEAGVPYDLETVQSSSSFKNMLNKSPIMHANKIKAPVLIELGEVDLRCPPSQGKELYFYLKAAGKKTKLLMYPKNSHPIAAVDAEADATVNKAIWLLENL